MKISHEELIVRIDTLKVLAAMQNSMIAIAVNTKAAEDKDIRSKLQVTSDLLDKMIKRLDKDSDE